MHIYDDVLHHLAEVKNNDRARRAEAQALADSTYPLRQIGRAAEVRERLDGAFARLKDLKLYPAKQIAPGSEPDYALRALADYEAGSGRIRQGVAIYEELLERVTASTPKPETNLETANNLSNIYAAMAALYHRAGRKDPATALEAQRLQLWQQWDRKLPNNPFVLRQLTRTSAPPIPSNRKE